MNILGKILVFLNLLFALAVGGFLLIDFQTRVNWKKAYKDLEQEMTVSKTNTIALQGTVKKQNDQLVEVRQKLVEEQNQRAVAKTNYDKLIDTYKNKMVTEEQLQKAILLAVDSKQKQLEKYALENKTLAGLLDKRDKQVLVLEENKDKYYKEMQQALNEKDIAVSRLDQLQKQLKDMTLVLAQKEVGKSPDGKGVSKIKGKNDPNPPPFYIKGTIVKVLPEDNSLVEISLGSDHGLAVGQTLEAFRKQPSPKYLGMVRIEEVTAHKSVGRLIPSPYSAPVLLKTGDEVASQILPGY